MMKALDKARQQGKCRFTGFSSHDRPHIKSMIEKYPDIVQVVGDAVHGQEQGQAPGQPVRRRQAARRRRLRHQAVLQQHPVQWRQLLGQPDRRGRRPDRPHGDSLHPGHRCHHRPDPGHDQHAPGGQHGQGRQGAPRAGQSRGPRNCSRRWTRPGPSCPPTTSG